VAANLWKVIHVQSAFWCNEPTVSCCYGKSVLDNWRVTASAVAKELHISTVIMQKQHSSSLMSWSRNSDESCHLGFWLFHDNAPAHKSFVAQQALCDCEFVQLNHPAYRPDLALSDYFLIRNLKCHLRGTWFTDDKSLAIAVEAWFESQNKKFYFRGINSWEEKLKKCVDVAGRRRICRKMTVYVT